MKIIFNMSRAWDKEKSEFPTGFRFEKVTRKRNCHVLMSAVLEIHIQQSNIKFLTPVIPSNSKTIHLLKNPNKRLLTIIAGMH